MPPKIMRLIGTKIYDFKMMMILGCQSTFNLCPLAPVLLCRSLDKLEIRNYVNIRIGGVVVKRTNANSVWMKVMMIMMVIDNLL